MFPGFVFLDLWSTFGFISFFFFNGQTKTCGFLQMRR